MRLLVLGTGPFAVPMLAALHSSAHDVVATVSRPPRGRRPKPSPVQQAAQSLGIADHTRPTVNSDEGREWLARLEPELLVVCDYGEILKPATLAVPPLGGINLHGSLLPKYRGAAPVVWAILCGEAETGNTVIRMTPSLDAGPCLAQERLAIDPDETAGQLEARLAEAGASLVVTVVDALTAGTPTPLEQDVTAATKAPRLKKSDGIISWEKPAQEIKNLVRAMQPWPKAVTEWHRSAGGPVPLILTQVRVAGGPPEETSPPGAVVETAPRLLVATGGGLLEIVELQPAGKRPMATADFLRGNHLQPGDRLGGALD